MLGGRAAEKLVFDEYSAGAEDDLKRATEIARKMVAHWGMSEVIGPVAFRQAEEHPFLGKEMHEQRQFSEETARIIDQEVQRFLTKAGERASKSLVELRGTHKRTSRKRNFGESGTGRDSRSTSARDTSGSKSVLVLKIALAEVPR
jgi:cell division protease FtsH